MSTQCLGFGLVTCDRLLLCDQFPLPNQKLTIENWTEQIGGPVAVGLMTMAALGVDVHWGLPLGHGRNSARVREQFQNLRIGLVDETVNSNSPTPEALILVERQNGSRTVLLLDQPSQLLQEFERVVDQLPRAEWIYCDGRDEHFVYALKDWARKNKSKLFFDLGSLRPNWEKIISDSEIVIVSDDFLRQWDASLTPEAALRRFAALDVKIVGMTLGQEGSVFLQEEKYVRFPAIAAKQVIDTTNAGDVFHGAFLAAFVKTGSLHQSAAFASRCAAWVVAQIGHSLNLLDQELVQQFGHCRPQAV